VRIVHVIQSVESGGAEQQLLALTRTQNRDLWQPFVVCTHEIGSLGPEFEAAGIPLEVIGKRSAYDIGLIRRLAEAIARHEPAIIQTWLTSANFWGRLAARLVPGDPILIAYERTIDAWLSPLQHTLDRVLTRGSDMVVGNSSQVSEFLIRVKRLLPEKVTTIRNGIALDRAQKCLVWSDKERRVYRERLGLPTEGFVVGNIAQPIREKRLDLLVEVIERLRQRGILLRVLQLGRDPRPGEEEYFADYRRWLGERGVRDLVLRRGFVRDVSPDLAVMDALVQTSDIEGFPNALIEAQAMEVPVVATAAGGTPDLVLHRRTGWLVPTGDVEGLVEGLEYIWRHREEARKWGTAARLRVENLFSVETLVRNTTALYAELLRKHGRAVPTEA